LQRGGQGGCISLACAQPKSEPLKAADARRSPPGEAWLFLRRPAGRGLPPNIFWLDEKGSLEKAARNLFAILRRIDRSGFALIRAEKVPGGGMADAINDRLRRAAGRP